mgnify:FL=1
MSDLYSNLTDVINRDLKSVNIDDELISNPREAFYHEPWSPYLDDQRMIWAASFRQYNPMESLTRMFMLGTQFEDKEDYDPFQDRQIIERVGEGNMWRFKDSGSPEETSYRIEKLVQDMEDMNYLAHSNSGFESVVASLFSPTTLAPLAPLRVLRSSSTMQRFLRSGMFTTAVMAPEELIMASQLNDRDLGLTAVSLAGAFIVGGSAGALLGGKNFGRVGINNSSETIMPYRSVGASANPETVRKNMYQTMEFDALAETGIGIEKLGWNPVIRMLKSPNPFIRSIAPAMVDVGGMIQKKVAKGIEMEQSVEATFRTTYISDLVKTMRSLDEEYLNYRKVTASESDMVRAYQMAGVMFKDFMKGTKSKISEYEFRKRVSKAMRNGDVDTVTDSATQMVNKAAKNTRKHYDMIKKNAEDVDLFGKSIGSTIAGLTAKIKVAKNLKTKAKLQKQLKYAEEALKDLKEKGISAGTSKSYLNRIWRVDKLVQNEDAFLKIVTKWAMKEFNYTQKVARTYAVDMLDTLTRSKPYLAVDDLDEIDFTTVASSAKLRNFKIPDEMVDDFLENDIEVLLRHHTKTMGIDIELTRRFDSVAMKETIENIKADYKRLIDETPEIGKRRELKETMENDLRDLRGLRDRLRGTYGASKDPHALSSRFVRGMKSFNVLVGMGSAVLSSVPDVARSVMVEGLDNFYKHGLMHMFRETPKALKKMRRSELEAAAVSADAVLGLRAMQFGDIGDTFGSRFTWERRMNQSTGVFFMLNGLNSWNQMMKEFSGGIIMFRMTSALTKPWKRLSKLERTKLLASGISQTDAERMGTLIKKHGKKDGKQWYPNTDAWTDVGDEYLVRKFRNALNSSVDRTIVTPGAGDRALWTSTEMGSLLTQFRGYSQGAMVRVLTAGLQEKDSAFWQGAIMLVTMGYLVNQLKKIQYGLEDENSFDGDLIDAIDRSGVLGWFTDVNNSLEKISDYKFGIRPLLTEQAPVPIPTGAKLGAMFGPAASNLTTAGGVATDILRNDLDQRTLDSLRFITPGGNLTAFDPIYDGIFGQ